LLQPGDDVSTRWSATTDIEDSETASLEEALDPDGLAAILTGDHPEPHRVLGAHPAPAGNRNGVVVTAFNPAAGAAECLVFEDSLPHVDGGSSYQSTAGVPQAAALEVLSTEAQRVIPMKRMAGTGLFAAFLPDATLPLRYRLRFHLGEGGVWEREDPYRFLPTIGELDLHLFGEGNHRRLWRAFGAHPRVIDGVDGVAFAVWAPNARRVSVVGDFCWWDGRFLPMRSLGSSGVFELFVPGLEPGALYKYEIKTQAGEIRLKSDPMALAMEMPPNTSSRVAASSFVWGDAEWMSHRGQGDRLREPMAIYEVHLGSWARAIEEGNRPLTYREIAPRLVEHVKRLGFTHVELLPVAEHPFTGSWGYQVTGFYAPTARYGTPDDFRFFVDLCHRNHIGVILDWVPAHFPKDDFALRRFDGTALYEHEDPRRGEHPDWGTLIFNYARNEVRNFLMANALFWLDEYHVDGLRVDAVASMLYLDYSRKEGEWLPNRYGGRENLEAVDFLKTLNETIRLEQPGCFLVAEESTAWPGVTTPVAQGGLGFTFKWNMGWMHDTLLYFSKDPIYRPYHHDQLTFAMIYEHTEHFIMPLSHDEVVHGKGSLLAKMPGDSWQKFANLRLLLSYQYTRPGKKLLFMGTELAPPGEWNHDTSLDWHLADDPFRAGLAHMLEDLGRLYRSFSCLWHADPDAGNFSWIDCSDRASSILVYVRRDAASEGSPAPGAEVARDSLLVVLNLSPVPRVGYRIGAPEAGAYQILFSSDHPSYGGSGFEMPAWLETEPVEFHGYPQSLNLLLPPLGALVLRRVGENLGTSTSQTSSSQSPSG
jgi:1,4-alpha-glucan branching enzyme